MMESQLAIGLVEDNPGDARLIQEMLREPPLAPYRLQCLSRLDEVLERVRREAFDVLPADRATHLASPGFDAAVTRRTIDGKNPGASALTVMP